MNRKTNEHPLLRRYRQDAAAGKISEDPEQLRILAILERLALELQAAAAPRGALSRLAASLGRRTHRAPQGVYLWGGVGRGKTYLMDLFFDSLEGIPSRRTHFHRFMQEVHGRLTALQGAKNPLERVAAEIAEEASLLCFDEFFVQDIADAMLLGGLLDALFERGVVLVATSNIDPDGLYRNGLQRARFLPAIALLKERTQVVAVRSGTDYRLRSLEQATLYYHPAGVEADRAMLVSLRELVASESHLQEGANIELLGRQLGSRWLGDEVVWFDFKQLCDGPRSAYDYVELARSFQSVFLSNIPKFDDTNGDQARRFINCIDELYDRRVKLIASAAEPITALYAGTLLAFEFERTASRLLEMQSKDYLSAAHRG